MFSPYIAVIAVAGSYSVRVTIKPTYYGRLKIPILLTFERFGKTLKILKEVVYKCVPNSQVFEEIKPVAPYSKPEPEPPSQLEIVRNEKRTSTE